MSRNPQLKNARSRHPWRRALWACLAALVALGACSRPDPGEVAARVAKQYYDQLLAGQYESFVDGQYRPDSIPSSYRQQLLTNARMFVGQQQDEHQGIKEVRVVSAQADTASHTAHVFLVFCYGDSTNEEVLVPMVEHKGVWYMR